MTPKELVKAVAAALRVEESSVVQFDRKLVEIELRHSTGGRGLSAPRMTASDAAANVLMVLAHIPGTNLSQTAGVVSALWRSPLITPTRRDFAIPIDGLADQETFGSALSLLIEKGEQLEAWMKGDRHHRRFQMAVYFPEERGCIGFGIWPKKGFTMELAELRYEGSHDTNSIDPEIDTRRRMMAAPLVRLAKLMRS